MASETDIAWLAGLLEGEGCFSLDPHHSSPRPRRVSLRVSLKMTDKDVVLRAADVIPSRTVVSSFPDTRSDKFTDCHQKTWNGADAERVMRAVLPYMGQRRVERIRECLDTPNLSHHPRVKAAA